MIPFILSSIKEKLINGDISQNSDYLWGYTDWEGAI